MRDTVAYLISTNEWFWDTFDFADGQAAGSSQNDIGVWDDKEFKRQIYVSVGSITRSEWNSAGNTGLKPSIMVKTPAVNYAGEAEIEVDGFRYAIYRTYTDTEDFIELYCERKAGVRHVTKDDS